MIVPKIVLKKKDNKMACVMMCIMLPIVIAAMIYVIKNWAGKCKVGSKKANKHMEEAAAEYENPNPIVENI